MNRATLEINKSDDENLKKAVEKAGQNFQQQYHTNSNTYQGKSNHDEIIKNTSTNGNPKATKKVGEYIDYEELD